MTDDGRPGPDSPEPAPERLIDDDTEGAKGSSSRASALDASNGSVSDSVPPTDSVSPIDSVSSTDSMSTTDVAATVRQALTDSGIDYSSPEPDAFLLTLPGERRHRTLIWLLVGDHELLFESFVCRRPDENDVEVFRYLLQRNARLRTVAYCVDRVGDIHLVGRIGLETVTAAEIDTVLGVLLSAADADFNPILQRGFASSIRREWAWRSATGQSLANLQAFRHLIESRN